VKENENIDVSTLLALRKVTRSLSEYLGKRLGEHLDVLTPLFNPRPVFGDRVRGGAKIPGRSGDQAFGELSDLYRAVNGARPFNLRREFEIPIDILSATPEVSAYSYSHIAKGKTETKSITVTSPLRWILTYKGFGPERLRGLLANPSDVGGNVQQCVLHYLVMHAVLRNRPGIGQLLQAMRFGLAFEQLEEFGAIPFPVITCPVSTIRPGDDTVVESTELSGTSTFEEVANVDDLAELRDPLRDKLMKLAKAQGADIS
jgi:hypothetical protein